jgi:hypothetical protein
MNGTNNRLRLTIDKIEVDNQDANLDVLINIKPFGGVPPIFLAFTIKSEDGELADEVGVYLNREQALILGQFMRLAAHVKEPD